jgi:transmembrane sensor
VLLSITVSLAYFMISGPVTYKTGVGEQVSFPLPDGSVVTLNAQSSLQLAYTERQRNVRLIGGEAFFDVAKDPDRPFEVHTKSAVARAVGTRFNVRFRGKNTTVTVVEGIVDVRPGPARGDRPRGAADPSVSVDAPGAGLPTVDKAAAQPQTVRLTVGQQAKVPPRAGRVAVTEIKTDKATSWRERRLVFDSWALSAVVEEFNLYNEQRIEVQDAGLAEQSISGVFSADDRASFVLFLAEADLAVAQTRADGTIVLRSPGGAR